MRRTAHARPADRDAGCRRVAIAILASRHTMLRYIVHRLLLMIPTLLGVAVLVFFMLRVMPGDVVEVKLRGDGGNVSQETIEAERKRLGLDKPLVYQFGDWMVGLATLDFGKSMWTGRPVIEEIAHPARAVAPGRDHGDDHRGAASRSRSAPCRRSIADTWIDYAVRMIPIGGPGDPVVLARHADHPGAAVRASTGCRRSPSRRSTRTRSPTSRS